MDSDSDGCERSVFKSKTKKCHALPLFIYLVNNVMHCLLLLLLLLIFSDHVWELQFYLLHYNMAASGLAETGLCQMITCFSIWIRMSISTTQKHLAYLPSYHYHLFPNLIHILFLFPDIHLFYYLLKKKLSI